MTMGGQEREKAKREERRKSCIRVLLYDCASSSTVIESVNCISLAGAHQNISPQKKLHPGVWMWRRELWMSK